MISNFNATHHFSAYQVSSELGQPKNKGNIIYCADVNSYPFLNKIIYSTTNVNIAAKCQWYYYAYDMKCLAKASNCIKLLHKNKLDTAETNVSVIPKILFYFLLPCNVDESIVRRDYYVDFAHLHAYHTLMNPLSKISCPGPGFRCFHKQHWKIGAFRIFLIYLALALHWY